MDLNCKIFNCDGGDCMQGSGARRNLECRDTGTRLFPSIEGCKPNVDGTCNGKPVFGGSLSISIKHFSHRDRCHLTIGRCFFRSDEGGRSI
jgi:hypothetical protein